MSRVPFSRNVSRAAQRITRVGTTFTSSCVLRRHTFVCDVSNDVLDTAKTTLDYPHSSTHGWHSSDIMVSHLPVMPACSNARPTILSTGSETCCKSQETWP